MLDRRIQCQRKTVTDRILRCYHERYLPQTVLVPSARFGLYAAAKELLAPGDRVIISPITCRTVIYALKSAGVTPVFADIDVATGNLDASRIPNVLLNDARAIVTTNLYGNPDCVLELKRMASPRGILLIEDCAHVLHTSLGGREIGSFGDVSVFSFKKSFHELGGVVTLRDEVAARAIEARVRAESALPPPTEERLRFIQFRLEQTGSRSLVAGLSRIYSRARKVVAVIRNGQAQRTAGDGHECFTRHIMPCTASLLRVLECLSRLDRLVAERKAAARNLIAECPLPVKRNDYAEEVCYLVVPFFFSGRDAVIKAVQRLGIATHFLYTPPMNVLFRVDKSLGHCLDTDAVECWCRNILPIDPQFSHEYLEAIRNVYSQLALGPTPPDFQNPTCDPHQG